jgi:hypothetical protein
VTPDRRGLSLYRLYARGVRRASNLYGQDAYKRSLNREPPMDLVYILSGVVIFLAFGLYALLLKGV